MIIVKQFEFEAAHHLPDHDGQCRNLHGHSYKVEVGISGQLRQAGPERGMVLDFAKVSKFWKREIEPLVDHNNQTLNGVMPGDFQPPTAENIALWLHHLLRLEFHRSVYDHPDVTVEFVRVWETRTSYAESRR